MSDQYIIHFCIATDDDLTHTSIYRLTISNMLYVLCIIIYKIIIEYSQCGNSSQHSTSNIKIDLQENWLLHRYAYIYI